MSEQIFTAVFEQDDSWWVAWCEEVPGAVTQGETIDEARENLKDAIRLVLEVRRELAAKEAAHTGRKVVRESVLVSI